MNMIFDYINLGLNLVMIGVAIYIIILVERNRRTYLGTLNKNGKKQDNI